MDLPFLVGRSISDLVEWLKQYREPSFRAKQIIEWIWRYHETDPANMTNLGLKLREALGSAFTTTPLALIGTETSADGETSKYLWRLRDGLCVESVLIRAPGRCTLCVSSQVGCPVRCVFCASGKQGLVRNLDVAEILGQFLAVAKTEDLTNIVYMGMGEPLRNYEAVVESIRRLTDPVYGGMSRRRITLSTVGVVEQIRRLAEEDVGVHLALSLHAPTQEIRQKIIPYARQYDLMDILDAVEQYRMATGRDITYEYILLSGVNDRFEDAQALCSLLRGRQGSVNLIPYNPIPGLTLVRPESRDVQAFRAQLDRAGIANTCRYTKGDDIAAACGQLAFRSEHSEAQENHN